MEKNIIHGQECFRGATLETTFDPELFHKIEGSDDDDNVQYALHTDIGSLTVLDRMTGFGWRDTETGFRDMDGKFWLASGGVDVTRSGAKTLGEAIEFVKRNANTCNPDSEKLSWKTCQTHGQDNPNVWGCPACLREAREALESIVEIASRNECEGLDKPTDFAIAQDRGRTIARLLHIAKSALSA